MSRTHYRKVFKSDHLGVADLEDIVEQKGSLVFTIDHVNQELGAKVAGANGNFNIAYFKEPIKPLVLNSSNSKTLKHLSGSPFLEDWAGMLIELYIDPNVKMMGDIVGGVRIRKVAPKVKKHDLTPNSPKWGKAKEAVKTGEATLESIRKHHNITDKNWKKLCG